MGYNVLYSLRLIQSRGGRMYASLAVKAVHNDASACQDWLCNAVDPLRVRPLTHSSCHVCVRCRVKDALHWQPFVFVLAPQEQTMHHVMFFIVSTALCWQYLLFICVKNQMRMPMVRFRQHITRCTRC